jgi:cell division septal protein FtsQ
LTLDSLEKIERKREARHRIRAQRERAGRLKARVVAISLICFALLWGVVFVQMATGNDPVLGDSSSTAVKGSNGRNRHAAKAAPAEAEAEPVEEEFVEEEPAPVTTGQS